MPQPPGSDFAVLSVINAFPPGCKIFVADVPNYATPAIIPGGKSLTDNPLTGQKETYHVPVSMADNRITPGIRLNG
jgi:hypothetical protein